MSEMSASEVFYGNCSKLNIPCDISTRHNSIEGFNSSIEGFNSSEGGGTLESPLVWLA
jgi:hypothetical protein